MRKRKVTDNKSEYRKKCTNEELKQVASNAA